MTFPSESGIRQAQQVFSDYRGFLEIKQGWQKPLNTLTEIRGPHVWEQTIRKALARGLYTDIVISKLSPQLVSYPRLYLSSNFGRDVLSKAYLVNYTMIEPEWIVDLPHSREANLAKKRGSKELLQPDVALALRQASQP
ncbi:hypothetical protein F4860DRAFT_516277 [Xylaria cubensis]|nr:hypothetical protein F4860DRAFT_516277 [Xylaria cubensis]